MRKCHANSWNVMSSNRIIQERQRWFTQDAHIRAIQQTKGLVDHKPPLECPHLARKLKTKKLQEDRAAEIQLENRILLQKMLNIDTKPSDLSDAAMRKERVRPRSLVAAAQRREYDRITKENHNLLKRLQDVPASLVASSDIEEEDRQALKLRICQNAMRSKSCADLPRPPRKRVSHIRKKLPPIQTAADVLARYGEDDDDLHSGDMVYSASSTDLT
eukprot:gnl/MRDRNA2_/MRDRNA2_100422_c0_seq1.p1 gnl/MRDRNA2_/MRDRNA2_100422_c0~~gnl/MRDRNA2_/MRDRNA2_100422_c0_seq1.p1  ORF type:complete len:217 (-),score=51.83 gnl/MRDRNA2_/MRDRNA2_100422_c0_seq1:61-711(-)